MWDRVTPYASKRCQTRQWCYSRSMKLSLALAIVTLGALGCVHPRTAEQMCTYSGMESVPASSPQCVAPPPPAPPPAPPMLVMCAYAGLEGIPASDPDCRVPTIMRNPKPPDLDPAYFAKNSSTLRADAAQSVDKVASVLKASPVLRVRVEGNDEVAHTNAEATRIATLRAGEVKSRLT